MSAPTIEATRERYTARYEPDGSPPRVVVVDEETGDVVWTTPVLEYAVLYSHSVAKTLNAVVSRVLAENPPAILEVPEQPVYQTAPGRDD